MDFGKLTSLEELIEAIDMGLDIVFVLHNVWYNISTNETPFVAVCPDRDGVHYPDGTTLVTEHTIHGVPLREQWQEMNIWAM